MRDSDLLLRWREGDHQAGERLVVRHYDRVYRFFRTKLDPTASEDLTQTTFERLCLNVAERSFKHGFKPHLFAIARFKLLEHVRSSERQRKHFDPLLHSVGDIDDDRSIVSLIASKRRLASFCGVLRKLPLDAQILIELKHYEEFTETELGAMFDQAPDVMRARVLRARHRLRREMQRIESEERSEERSEEELEGELREYLDALRQNLSHPLSSLASDE